MKIFGVAENVQDSGEYILGSRETGSHACYLIYGALKPGEKGQITAIGAIGPLKRRLMDMGVLVGEEVKMEKVAPLGDPIEVTIKNYNLSLRKKEAEEILVEVAK